MDVLAISIIGLGCLVAVIGGIMLLVAAFRESVVWGLCYLFLPFAALVFVCMHWDAARRGFLLNLAGLCVAFTGVFASPSVRQGFSAAMPPAFAPMLGGANSEKTAGDLNAQISAKREQISQTEEQLRTDGAVLTQQFQALNTRRAALKGNDPAAVDAFNAEAAAYQQKNEALKQLRAQLDTAQQELSALLDERSRMKGTPAPGGPAKQRAAAPARPAASAASTSGPVIIYTTSRCGWCTKAKQYFASKGVRYEERDVERSPAARQEFERLGGRGVPLILVGSEKMEGFNQQRLDQLL